MANRNLKRPFVYNYGEVLLSGSFRPNGASAVSNTTNTGHGFTVARTSAGVFTITLSDKFNSLISVGGLSLQLSAPDDKIVQWGAIDVVTGKTAVINVWDISGAAVADVASNASNRIHFTLVVKNSTVSF
jgi:hypothetical protein